MLKQLDSFILPDLRRLVEEYNKPFLELLDSGWGPFTSLNYVTAHEADCVLFRNMLTDLAVFTYDDSGDWFHEKPTRMCTVMHMVGPFQKQRELDSKLEWHCLHDLSVTPYAKVKFGEFPTYKHLRSQPTCDCIRRNLELNKCVGFKSTRQLYNRQNFYYGFAGTFPEDENLDLNLIVMVDGSKRMLFLEAKDEGITILTLPDGKASGLEQIFVACGRESLVITEVYEGGKLSSAYRSRIHWIKMNQRIQLQDAVECSPFHCGGAV